MGQALCLVLPIYMSVYINLTSILQEDIILILHMRKVILRLK